MQSDRKRENRVFQRTRARIPVAVLTRGQRRSVRHQASILQVSFLGMRVLTNIPLKHGQSVRIVRMTGAYVAVPARVVWVGARVAGKQRQVGLKFTDPMHARIGPR